jgi:hypothetical protein
MAPIKEIISELKLEMSKTNKETEKINFRVLFGYTHNGRTG